MEKVAPYCETEWESPVALALIVEGQALRSAQVNWRSPKPEGASRHTRQIVVGQATPPEKVHRATPKVNSASVVACRTVPAESAGPLRGLGRDAPLPVAMGSSGLQVG